MDTFPYCTWHTNIWSSYILFDANPSGKAGYKSEDLWKVEQRPHDSVQKSELYAIFMVLRDFKESFNIVTNSQYAERVVLHIEITEFVPGDTQLTLLFIQSQNTIRNRNHPVYITHIWSHMGLPGPLAHGNAEINQLLIGNILKSSEFHKNNMSIAKVFSKKKTFRSCDKPRKL